MTASWWWRWAAAGGVMMAVAASLPAAATEIETTYAILRAMDKRTGRVSTMDVVVGEVVRFGSLELTVQTCMTRPPEETPENAAFLRIVDVKLSAPPEVAFAGWMFSSSPAVSAMDHAIYDVWVLECTDNLASAPASAESDG